MDEIRFNGSDYVPEIDDERLKGQMERVVNLMKDGNWRTLSEISGITSDPPASISAQLRHLRKKRFGSHTVLKRNRGDRKHGLFEYKLILNIPQYFCKNCNKSISKKQALDTFNSHLQALCDDCVEK